MLEQKYAAFVCSGKLTIQKNAPRYLLAGVPTGDVQAEAHHTTLERAAFHMCILSPLIPYS